MPPNIPAAKRAGLRVDIERLARDGDTWLTAEDRYALKTYGVCAQAQPGVFMIRVRIPGGQLGARQARALADLADDNGAGWIHLTTRQNVELHHVDARAVPAVLAAVDETGLTNRSACGHTLRNVMACPDAGVGLDEPFDCRPDALAASAAIVARSATLNCQLPSRINMAFGGCPACAEHARVNDCAFQSIVVDGEPGYRLWAGGSLGVSPFLAMPLTSLVPRHHVLAAVDALIDTFIANGDIDDPKRGRMKFVIEAMGERAFRRSFFERYDVLRRTTTYEPDPVAVPAVADITEILRRVPDGGWSPAVRPQRTAGLASVTVHVPLGDLSGDELRGLAEAAHRGDGELHLTRNQNVQLRDIAVDDVRGLRADVRAIGLDLVGADTAVDVRACTGTAVCSLAIAAAPDTGHRVASSAALARNSALRVNVSGCPNSCAQHQAADIGLAGAKVRVNGVTRVGYSVFVGADLASGRLAQVVGRVADEGVHDVVDGLIGAWEVVRQPGERLADTVQRVGIDAFAAHVTSIASGFVAGAEPDPISPIPTPS